MAIGLWWCALRGWWFVVVVVAVLCYWGGRGDIDGDGGVGVVVVAVALLLPGHCGDGGCVVRRWW